MQPLPPLKALQAFEATARLHSFSAAGEMVLNLAGVGKVSLSDVQTIGI